MKLQPISLIAALHILLVAAGASPAHAAEPGLKVQEQTAARGVAERKAVEPGDRFAANGEVVAIVSVVNPGAPTEVTQRWLRDGKVRFTATLKVGTAKTGWRTWSRHRMSARDAGAWTVETAAPDGAVLSTLPFQIDAPASAAVAGK